MKRKLTLGVRLVLWSAMAAAFLFGMLHPGKAATGALTQDVTIQHGGITRYFDYYVPANLPSEPVPLVIVLHGGTGDNKYTEGLDSPGAAWMDLADIAKFIVIYPNGTDPSSGVSGPSGSFNWNDCRSDAGNATTSADDVGFISTLIDLAAAYYNINLNRVYVTGLSNGGLMSYRLAFQLSHRIAAIAVGVANLPINNESSCIAPANPIPVLIMNGTADNSLMPYNGGQIANDNGLVMSAEATRDYWRNFLGTGATPAITNFPDFDTGDNSTVTRELYSNGVQGTEVSFHKVIGGGHELPSVDYRIGLIFQLIVGKQNHDIEFVVEAWNFFERHQLNGTLNGPTMAVYYGVAADDGWTLESSETSGVGGSRNNSDIGTSALRVGDNGSDRQYRTIVSFDTSPIPDGATILSTTLRLRRGSLSGTNPFTTHGACYLDVKTGGFNANAALENADFQALADAVQAGALDNATANGAVSDGALDSAGRAAVNKTGKTQMRVYFSLDDNDDSGVDYVGFYSANNSTWRNRPRIYVQYQ